MRESISNNVLWSLHIGKGGGELGKEGKVALLSLVERSSRFGNCSDQVFVIGKEGEQRIFKGKTKVTDGDG